jgi:hypothetical protein
MSDLDMKALKTHARLAAVEHLLQNLYYMHYRRLGATQNDLETYHKALLDTVREDLAVGRNLKISQSDPEQAAAIASEVEAAVFKNLDAIRAMFLETPRAY